MTDAQANIKKLSELCDLGVTLAVDDFGTGYSSLSYLRQFPINVLKIDRSFVMGIGTENGNAIVDAITSLAKALNLGLVAEGVETKEQMDYLVASGCDTLQGFYLSRPVPAKNIIGLLTKPFEI
jgi:EAL domain-containing protein (putative c-di-GMP-specific phosphodiesterase class I)